MDINIEEMRKQNSDLQEYIKQLDKTPNGNIDVDLSLSEIAKEYPNQWVGLIDVNWGDEDKTSIISAKVGYLHRTVEDLSLLQSKGVLYAWYTTPDEV